MNRSLDVASLNTLIVPFLDVAVLDDAVWMFKAAFGRREIFLCSSRNFAEAFGQHISRKKLYLSQMRHTRRR